MHIYARTTVITNVVGRADYVSNPDRQENLLAVAGIQDKSYWRQLAKDCKAARLQAGGDKERGKREAREICVQLPKKILDMSQEERQQLTEGLSAYFLDRYGAENIVGLHLSQTDGNVHAHVLFPERRRLPEPEIRVADRNAFIDERGVRRRTKKEILDADGQLRPGCRIIPKGKILSTRHFGPADPVFNEKAWLHDCKQDLCDWINENLEPDKLRTVFDPAGPYLAQEKIGKGKSDEKEARIRAYNADVKAFNAAVEDGRISEEQAQEIKLQVMLSPDRLQGLRAATYMAFENKAPVAEQLQGGVRTASGPDEAKKRQLRELFRKAADFRRRAKEAENSLDRNMLMAEARKCSAQIDRLRIELGYLKPEEELRKMQQISLDLSRKRDWMLKTRGHVVQWDRRRRGLQRGIDYYEKQLSKLPLFKSEYDKQRARQLKGKLQELQAKQDKVLRAERDAAQRAKAARKAYREAKKQAKLLRKAMKKRQRQLQQEKERETER